MKNSIICKLVLGLVLLLNQKGFCESIFISPNKRFQAEMLNSIKKDTLENGGGQMLTIWKDGQKITQVSTMGYILSAIWSPDGKYVAINNRNANSGDYLWIISLQSGKVLKKPFDTIAIDVSTIKKEFPNFKHEEAYKEVITATKWNSSNSLQVKRVVFYKNNPRFLSIEMICKLMEKDYFGVFLMLPRWFAIYPEFK